MPPPPKQASSSHQVGVRTLQLHSAAGDGQDLCGPSVSAGRLAGSTSGKPLSENSGVLCRGAGLEPAAAAYSYRWLGGWRDPHSDKYPRNGKYWGEKDVLLLSRDSASCSFAAQGWTGDTTALVAEGPPLLED